MRETEPVVFNPYLPEVIQNPYPLYHRLRTEDPVHLTPLGIWVLTRYDDVAFVLRDGRFGRGGFEARYREIFGVDPSQAGFALSMLHKDPPDHTRLRGLVNKAFTPRVVDRLRPNIQQIVDALIDRVRDTGRTELIEDLAYPLPVTVICEMVGVPVGDRERFKQWSLDVARSLDVGVMNPDPVLIEQSNRARRDLAGYFRELIAERRQRPRDDLMTGLIAAEEQGDVLSEGELIATLILLFIAGHETTVNLIGNGVLALLRNPDELRRLQDDPGLIESAVEELLRYDGPVQRTARTANADVTISGHPVQAGQMVVALLGAANRDPAHFPDPDRLDVARSENRHLAFGWGIHFCLGAPLARLEGQIAIATLFRRLPGLRLATDKVEWRETSVLRGLKALPLEF
jgi:pimeloyl-[acyl-carrier protein] synthase